MMNTMAESLKYTVLCLVVVSPFLSRAEEYGSFGYLPQQTADEQIRQGESHEQNGRAFDARGILQFFQGGMRQSMDTVNSGIDEAAKVVQTVRDGLLQGGIQGFLKSMPDAAKKLIESYDQVLAPLQPHLGTTGSLGGKDVQARASGMLLSVMRMFGFDQQGFALMALNAVIFMAELITSAFMQQGGDNGSRENLQRSLSSFRESYLNFMEAEDVDVTNSPLLNTILSGDVGELLEAVNRAQDEALPQHVIDNLTVRTGNDTACVQLLVCKLTPLIWGVQKTVKNPAVTAARGFTNTLDLALPPIKEFNAFGDACEGQFPACNLVSLNFDI